MGEAINQGLKLYALGAGSEAERHAVLENRTRQRQHVLQRDDIQALAGTLLEEGVAVARAEGAALSDTEVADTQRLFRRFPRDAGSSMYFDALAGRPLEGDALTGAVVAAGERHGIPTPANRMILTLLRAFNIGLGD